MKRLTLEIRPFGNYCNKNCDYCYQNAGKFELIEERIFRKFLFYVDSYLRKEGFDQLKVIFHGGEPLWDAGKIVARLIYIVQEHFETNMLLNISYGIHTNGLTLHQAVDILPERANFAVSIDQPRTVVDLDKNYYKKIYDALEIVSPKRVKVQVVLSEKFCAETSDSLIKLLDQLGSFHVKLVFFLNRFLDKKEWQSHIFKYLNTLINKEIYVEPINELVLGKVAKGCQYSGYGCIFKNANDFSMCLDSDGLVYPCNRYAAIKSNQLSNMNEVNDIEEFWNETLSQKFFQCPNLKSCSLSKSGYCNNGGCKFEHDFLDNESMPYQCNGMNDLMHNINTQI